MKYYAGIGSRKTPLDIIKMMTSIASCLEMKEWILRSGGAIGADSAFEYGVHDKVNHAEIFKPDDVYDNWDEALKIAQHYHTHWDRLKPSGIRLITRNTYQILGRDLNTPSRFVICWTADGKSSGGTGQALRIAEDRNIPIFNLKLDDDRRCIQKFIDELYGQGI